MKNSQSELLLLPKMKVNALKNGNMLHSSVSIILGYIKRVVPDNFINLVQVIDLPAILPMFISDFYQKFYV